VPSFFFLRAGSLADRAAEAYVGGRRDPAVNQSSEPIFNIPAVVVAALAVFAGIHAFRSLVLDAGQDLELLILFAFIPARYDTALLLEGALPGGVGAQVWTFVSYALIHADIMHLGINSLWFVPFGSAVARRFGTARFLLFFAATAAAGAGAHLITHLGEVFPVIGASAAVSGMMAAAIRFAFQPHGPIALWQQKDDRAYHIRALPLLSALRDPRIFVFLVVWFGLNLLFGLGSLPLVGAGQSVAWEAHIGGFLAGLLLFSLFDPVPRAPRLEESGEDMPQ
jgi:membrane associated rhomboid family serine protease